MVNADTNQWITPDWYPGTQGNPLSQRAYTWVGNDPTGLLDPSGFDPDRGKIGITVAEGVGILALGVVVVGLAIVSFGIEGAVAGAVIVAITEGAEGFGAAEGADFALTGFEIPVSGACLGRSLIGWKPRLLTKTPQPLMC